MSRDSPEIVRHDGSIRASKREDHALHCESGWEEPCWAGIRLFEVCHFGTGAAGEVRCKLEEDGPRGEA